MATTHLEIVTPTRQFTLGEITYLRAPSTNGLFGVMPRHVQSVFALDVGEVAVEADNKRQYFAIGGGFAEVYGDHIVMIVQSAERAEDINKERAEAAAQRAKERLAHKDDGEEKTDVLRAEVALKRALNRLSVVNKL